MNQAFSLAEMYSELKEILAIQAGLVCGMFGTKFANDLLGFNAYYDERDSGWEDQNVASEINNKSLDKYWATDWLEQFYNLAFVHSGSENDIPFDVDSNIAETIRSAIPQRTAHGERPKCLTSEGLCMQLLEYTLAVGKVATFLGGAASGIPWLTVDQLALLARINEGSLRNALSQSKAELQPQLLGEDSRVGVRVDRAVRWASGRRKFRAKQITLGGGLTAVMFSERPPDAAMAWIATRLFWNGGSPVDVREKLGWDENRLTGFLEGQFPKDDAELKILAKLTKLPFGELRDLAHSDWNLKPKSNKGN